MAKLESQDIVGSVRRNRHIPAKVDQLHARHVVQRKLILKVRRVLDDFLRREHLSVPRLLQECQKGLGRLLLLLLNAVGLRLLLRLLLARRSLLLFLCQILQCPAIRVQGSSQRLAID